MQDRVVAVAGAGNMRCAAPVMGSMAVWAPDDLVEIRLFDANEERLDLVDRLLREALDVAGTEHVVKSSPSVEETMDGATEIIVTYHEDCVRRMHGRVPPVLYSPEEPGKLVDQVRGDPNKPTPPERLSEQTQTYLSMPTETEASREELLQSAIDYLEDRWGELPMLNLVRGVAPSRLPLVTSLNWPSELSVDQLQLVPHQILRWIHGDASLDEFLETCRESPVLTWLKRI
ncbi:MAG: hypothetical protein JSS66_01225 [Armatimonadetes bacterium]|nr:hypothetical protein [Armatimonadota bacterium]